MSNRLNIISSYITDGVGVADVGTDHGYLPLLLLKRGYKGNVIATDINPQPLQKAEQNLREAGFEDKVKLVLCDGLEGVSEEDIDTVVIAGMGGDTITGILDRAEWSHGKKLILQPVTKPEILRYWLINNCFEIFYESLCEENGTIYELICARAGESERYSDAELYVGKYELIKKSELFSKHIDIHIKRFENAVKGLRRRRREGLEAWLQINENILYELKAMREKNEFCK